MTLVGLLSRGSRTLACSPAGLSGVGSSSLPCGGPFVAFAADETPYRLLACRALFTGLPRVDLFVMVGLEGPRPGESLHGSRDVVHWLRRARNGDVDIDVAGHLGFLRHGFA